MTVHRSTAPTAVKMGVTTGIYMHTAVSWSTSTRSSGRYRGCIGGQSTSTLSRPERTRVGRYGQRADRRDQLFEASWKGHPGAGVRHGLCSIATGLRANLGEVHPVTEAPRGVDQPLRLWGTVSTFVVLSHYRCRWPWRSRYIRQVVYWSERPLGS